MTFIDPWTVEIEAEEDWPTPDEIREALAFYQKEITRLMMHYGNISEAKAIEEQEWIWKRVKTHKKASNYFTLLHESPYYWAMATLLGREYPRWYLDPKYWPEPKDKKHK